MSLWRQFTRGLRGLTRRSATEQDLTDEVQDYLAHAAAAHRAAGLAPEDAARAARLEAGSATSLREQVRGYGWENALLTFLADLRYAARRLRSAPGFTLLTMLTLALGLGGTTAIFSAVQPILFAPLPYPDPSRIAMVWEIRSDGGRNEGTFGGYRELVDRTRTFDALAVLKPWQPTISGGEQPERLEGQRVSASYFRVLGIAPWLGRDFQDRDDRARGPNAVILSDALWRRRFGADRAIVGRQITLNDTGYVVIGIMPAGFDNVLAEKSELWAPLQYDVSEGRAWGHHLRTVGRLRAGVSLEQAEREVSVLGAALVKSHPEYGSSTLFSVVSLHQDLTRGVRRTLLAILGGVMLVLVIACVNVTNLLLARGAQRRGEFALRAALGAGRGRLIRQLLTESLLLALLGGVAGMAVALLGVRALMALSPPGLPRAGAIGVNGTVFAFGLGLTTLIGLAFGLLPALQAAHNAPNRDLQRASRRTAGGHRRARGVLVVTEVALALVLLVSSGLLMRSLQRLFAVEAGFDATELLTLQVSTVGRRFEDNRATLQFFAQVLEAVRELPGVSSAALTSQLPMSGDLDEYGVHFAAGPTQTAASYSAFRYGVSPGYLETMRIPLRSGRLLDQRDRADTPLAALISESLARLRFPGQSPLGQQLRIGPDDGAPYRIVGVVGDVRQQSLALSASEAVYIASDQGEFFADRVMSLVVRARGDAEALASAVRQAIWSVDKNQPIVRIATVDELLTASAAERRFALILFGAFALAALVLAAAGIYGVLSGSVVERTREIGVRTALGASRGRIVGLVLRQGLLLTGLGLVVGLAGAAGAGQAIAAMLFGVSPLDLVTYTGVVILLGGVAALACSVPAWRAARVDPVSTLKAE